MSTMTTIVVVFLRASQTKTYWWSLLALTSLRSTITACSLKVNNTFQLQDTHNTDELEQFRPSACLYGVKCGESKKEKMVKIISEFTNSHMNIRELMESVQNYPRKLIIGNIGMKQTLFLLQNRVVPIGDNYLKRLKTSP